MKRVRRTLPIFLALVMCVTSILPVYATGDGTTISTGTTGSFATTNGSVMFEAEDVRINTENDVVKMQTIMGTTSKTTASGQKAVRMCSDLKNLSNLSYADNISNLGFDVTVDKAGTYYVWARVAVHNESYVKIWLSKDQGNYVDTRVLPKNSELFNNDNRYNPSFVWVKLATIEDKGVEDSIHVDIKPRQGNKYYGVIFDAFVVTSNDTTPTDTELLSVASINGTEYASLEAAIDAAGVEDTIMLLNDVTSSEAIEITSSGITLDLNGNTLDMGNNFLLFNGDVVDNSTNKAGRLKIATYAQGEVEEGKEELIGTPKGKLAEDNSQMPVYIPDESAYMLASMTAQALTPTIDTDYFTSVSRPSFGDPHYNKLQSGASAAKLQFILRLDWTKEGIDYYQEFSYSDDLVQNVYTNGKAFSVTVNGLTDYASSMKVSEYVKSDLGVVLKNNSFSMNTTSGK